MTGPQTLDDLGEAFLSLKTSDQFQQPVRCAGCRLGIGHNPPGIVAEGRERGNTLDLEENGMVIEKVWTSVGNRSVRPAHMTASAQRVRGSQGLFHVGGSSAPYPCHWSLPARQRVRCRCGVVVEEVAGA